MNVGILGLGLMGGSLAQSLRAHVPDLKLATVEREDPDIVRACEAKVIDHVFSTLGELVDWADWIFLATPLLQIVPLAKEIRECGSKRLIVVDLGSVKTALFLDM